MYGSAVILLATQLAVSWGLQGTVPLFLENGKLDPIADRSSRNVAVRARDSFDLPYDQCSASCRACVGTGFPWKPLNARRVPALRLILSCPCSAVLRTVLARRQQLYRLLRHGQQ